MKVNTDTFLPLLNVSRESPFLCISFILYHTRTRHQALCHFTKLVQSPKFLKLEVCPLGQCSTEAHVLLVNTDRNYVVVCTCALSASGGQFTLQLLYSLSIMGWLHEWPYHNASRHDVSLRAKNLMNCRIYA
jgi:hypothetical protein